MKQQTVIDEDLDALVEGNEDDALEALFKEVSRPEFEWQTVAAVALFHKQNCSMCGDEHKFFVGWYTEQKHRTDKFSRRLTKGKPIEPVLARMEIHDQGVVPLCATCVLIDQAIGKIQHHDLG